MLNRQGIFVPLEAILPGEIKVRITQRNNILVIDAEHPAAVETFHLLKILGEMKVRAHISPGKALLWVSSMMLVSAFRMLT